MGQKCSVDGSNVNPPSRFYLRTSLDSFTSPPLSNKRYKIKKNKIMIPWFEYKRMHTHRS